MLWGPRGRQRLDFKVLRCGSEKPNARDPCKKMRPDKRPPNKKVLAFRDACPGVGGTASHRRLLRTRRHPPRRHAPPVQEECSASTAKLILTAASGFKAPPLVVEECSSISRAPDARPLSPNDLRETPVAKQTLIQRHVSRQPAAPSSTEFELKPGFGLITGANEQGKRLDQSR